MSTIECPYRRPVNGSPEGQLATCGVLRELTGVTDDTLCRVRPDACRACCTWFRPSPQHINPVVASALYCLTSQIIDRGGMPGCDPEQALRLNELACENIPYEQDFVSDSDTVHGQANVDCVDLSTLIPRPRRRCGPHVTRWAVAVTTAPRAQPTLDACLMSLAAAGWERPRLFVDGPVRLPDSASNLPATRRDPHIGAWPSYYLALVELVMRAPHADAYMLVQDDAVLFQHAMLRSYLEEILWPGKRPGVISLFCSRAYTRHEPGWHQLNERFAIGALTIIFSQEAALGFLRDSKVIEHRLSPGADGLTNIDGVIGEWALRTRVPIHLPTPSLVQHVGHVSSLWPEVRAFGTRRANRFAGDRNA